MHYCRIRPAHSHYYFFLFREKGKKKTSYGGVERSPTYFPPSPHAPLPSSHRSTSSFVEKINYRSILVESLRKLILLYSNSLIFVNTRSNETRITSSSYLYEIFFQTILRPWNDINNTTARYLLSFVRATVLHIIRIQPRHASACIRKVSPS